jgi:hypothetical protein
MKREKPKAEIPKGESIEAHVGGGLPRSLCRECEWSSFHSRGCKLDGSLAYRIRLAGGGCKPVYAAIAETYIVVNDTFKRQYKLSGEDIGDERK